MLQTCVYTVAPRGGASRARLQVSAGASKQRAPSCGASRRWCKKGDGGNCPGARRILRTSSRPSRLPSTPSPKFATTFKLPIPDLVGIATSVLTLLESVYEGIRALQGRSFGPSTPAFSARTSSTDLKSRTPLASKAHPVRLPAFFIDTLLAFEPVRPGSRMPVSVRG